MHDLAVTVLWREIGRQFKVIDEQHVVADADIRSHQIADRASRTCLRDEWGRDPALLLRFFEQRLDDAVTVADAAGDNVVEFVGRDALIRRAAADPQVQFSIDQSVAVQMHAIGAYAEKRHGAAVDPEHRRLTPAHHDVKGLVAPLWDLFFDDERLDHLVHDGADRVDISVGDEPDAFRLSREDMAETAKRGRIFGRQPADPPIVARQQRYQASRVGVIAGADMIGEGHCCDLVGYGFTRRRSRS